MTCLLPTSFHQILLVIVLSVILPVVSSINNEGTTQYLQELIHSGGAQQSLDIQEAKSVFKDFINKKLVVEECNSFNSSCWKNQCQTLENLLNLHNMTELQNLNSDAILNLSPALLYNHRICTNHSRVKDGPELKEKHRKPSSTASWGYGFLFVTIINICSLSGAIVLPFMRKTIYHKLLIFMVALAVGSLAASGLLVLIPEALGLVQNPEGHEDYIWKCTTVVGGIYLFFLIERFLKIHLSWRQKKAKEKFPGEDFHHYEIAVLEDGSDTAMDEGTLPSIKEKTPVNSSQKYKDTSHLPIPESKSTASTVTLEDALNRDRGDQKLQNGGSLGTENGDAIGNHGHSHGKGPVKTVAWMIIFGDGLHNFIDGLSIGAAFTDSIFAGISISVAVICEELPHELGDFAILLNAGMSVKRALFYNFLSACMCYIGLVAGTLLGENTHSHEWIFAIAGGMFLYIALVDMMPEMNSASESPENKRLLGTWWIFFTQNIGMAVGFGVILILSVYGGEINFEG